MMRRGRELGRVVLGPGSAVVGMVGMGVSVSVSKGVIDSVLVGIGCTDGGGKRGRQQRDSVVARQSTIMVMMADMNFNGAEEHIGLVVVVMVVQVEDMRVGEAEEEVSKVTVAETEVIMVAVVAVAKNAGGEDPVVLVVDLCMTPLGSVTMWESLTRIFIPVLYWGNLFSVMEAWRLAACSDSPFVFILRWACRLGGQRRVICERCTSLE